MLLFLLFKAVMLFFRDVILVELVLVNKRNKDHNENRDSCKEQICRVKISELHQNRAVNNEAPRGNKALNREENGVDFVKAVAAEDRRRQRNRKVAGAADAH